MSQTILVTGGAGFIGSAVCRRLLRDGAYRVVNVDKLTYAANVATMAEFEDHPRYVFERTDIQDAVDIRRIIEEYEPAAIVHLAAESHVDRSIDAPAAFIETNIFGTYVLLQEARRHGIRFVHVSTDEVFGSLGDRSHFTHESRYDPSSPYSASKAAADHLARAWHRTFGIPVIVTNCSNNYGPYQFPEKLIPLTIVKALAGERLPIYGRGINVRDWLYVDDHASALQLALESGEPGETYLIGGESERRNIDVVRSICRLLDELRPRNSPYEDLIEFVLDRPGHDLRYAVDTTHVRRTLDWSPTETFETGLRKTVVWYLENEEWWRRIQSGEYRGERLGLL